MNVQRGDIVLVSFSYSKFAQVREWDNNVVWGDEGLTAFEQNLMDLMDYTD